MVDSHLKIIQTREIFNILGDECIPLGNTLDDNGHVTTQTLKNWIRENLINDLSLQHVDNTPDINKPLTESQKLYIDGYISGLNIRIRMNETEIDNLKNRVQVLEQAIIELQNP